MIPRFLRSPRYLGDVPNMVTLEEAVSECEAVESGLRDMRTRRLVRALAVSPGEDGMASRRIEALTSPWIN